MTGRWEGKTGHVSEQPSQPEMLLKCVYMFDERNIETQGHLQSSLDGLNQLTLTKITINERIQKKMKFQIPIFNVS